MSDDLTEAVRRLRGLREDVERLKAARDDAGEVRYLRLFEDVADVEDIVDVTPDFETGEVATTDDALDTATEVAEAEVVVTSDESVGETDTIGKYYWNDQRWGVDGWDAIEFLDLDIADIATAADSITTQTDVQETDTATAADSIVTKTRDVQPVYWNDHYWNVDGWR